jgi:hypothetical protein
VALSWREGREGRKAAKIFLFQNNLPVGEDDTASSCSDPTKNPLAAFAFLATFLP